MYAYCYHPPRTILRIDINIEADEVIDRITDFAIPVNGFLPVEAFRIPAG